MSTSGKGNRTRKTLSFFRVNFGHTPPFEVLCDGPTIFQSLKNDLYLKQSLPKLLGGPTYPVVTECVVNELRTLGDDYSNAALFAKRVKRIPCVHEGKAIVAECLTSLLRNPSETKFLLASTDPDVIAKVIRIPGIPIISIVNQKKFLLKAPSPATLRFVKESEKQKTQTLSDPDRALVDGVKAAEQQRLEKRLVRKKRKRAKGPNPLSVKKPKISHEKSSGNQQRRSSLLSRPEVSPGDTPIVSDMPNDEANHLVSRDACDEALEIKLKHEAERKRSRRQTNDDVEIADLRTKSVIKEVGEPKESPISGSGVAHKAFRKRRSKHGTENDDTSLATMITADDLPGTIDPVSVCLRGEECLTLKDRSDSVAGGSERRRAQDIPTATKEVTERASNDTDTDTATDTYGHAKAQRPETLFRQTPTPNAEEHGSNVHKATANMQMTKSNLEVPQGRDGNGSHATTERLKNVAHDTDNTQLTAMDQTKFRPEDETETTSAEMDGKKKKKQRKNRRRRPKKKASV